MKETRIKMIRQTLLAVIIVASLFGGVMGAVFFTMTKTGNISITSNTYEVELYTSDNNGVTVTSLDFGSSIALMPEPVTKSIGPIWLANVGGSTVHIYLTVTNLPPGWTLDVYESGYDGMGSARLVDTTGATEVFTINSGETRRVRLDFDITIPAGEPEGSHAIDFEFSAGDS